MISHSILNLMTSDLRCCSSQGPLVSSVLWSSKENGMLTMQALHVKATVHFLFDMLLSGVGGLMAGWLAVIHFSTLLSPQGAI